MMERVIAGNTKIRFEVDFITIRDSCILCKILGRGGGGMGMANQLELISGGKNTTSLKELNYSKEAPRCYP